MTINGVPGTEKYGLVFAACRDLGHAWQYVSWTGHERTIVCVSCGTQKTERLNGYDVQRRVYAYPKGYKVTGLADHRHDFITALRKTLQKHAGSKGVRWAKATAGRERDLVTA